MADLPSPSGRIVFRQRRDAGAVIGDTVTFIREEFADLGRGLLYIAGPFVLLAIVFNTTFQGRVFEAVLDPEADPEAMFSLFGPVYFLSLFAVFAAQVLVVTVGYAYVFRYMEAGPGVPVAELWAETKGLLGRVVLTYLGLYLLLIASAVLNILPCLGTLAWIAGLVYFAPALSLLLVARLTDASYFFEAFRRARELVEGYWGQTFGVAIMAFGLVLIVSMAFGMPAMFLLFATGFHGAAEGGALFRGLMTFSAVLGALSYLLYVIPAVATAMQYYNLAERKEGRALEDRIEAIGQEGDVRWDDFGEGDAGRPLR